MTMLAEDAKTIEAEVMAEIRSALNLSEVQSPTSIMSIQKVSSSPQESSTTETEGEESSEEEERVTFVKVKDGSPKRTSLPSLDGSGNDSFVNRLNLSCSSSIGGSSTGTSDSSYQKFYIGTVSEESEECSIQSHVSDIGADEMSHRELVDVVQRLYLELKKVDEALSAERKRRHSREKSLIKLAKELGRRKSLSNKQLEEIHEMYEALSTIRSEKAVLEERLEAQMQNAEEIRAAAREELIEIRQKHEGTVSEHDERIILINRMHANQCEQLCREVVEANQEVIRLQNVLADMTRGAYPVDRTFVSTISREDTARSLPSTTTSSRSRRADTYVTLLLLFAAVFLGYTLQSFQSIREVIEPVDAYNRTIVLNVDITSHQNEFCQDNDLGRSFDEIPWDFETSLDTSLESVDMTTQIKSLEQVLSSTDLRGIFFDSSLPFKWLGARVAALKKKSTQVHE